MTRKHCNSLFAHIRDNESDKHRFRHGKCMICNGKYAQIPFRFGGGDFVSECVSSGLVPVACIVFFSGIRALPFFK